MKTSKRRSDDDRQQAAQSLIRDVREQSVYDCMELDARRAYGDSGWIRLFGNMNIGQQDLTNLQVPGQFPCDQAYLVGGWHARTDIDLSPTGDRELQLAEAFRTWSHHVHVRLNVGSHPERVDVLHNLLQPHRPRSWPVLIPPRQNFDVSVDRYGDQDRLQRYIEQARPIAHEGTTRLWIYLDGIIVPEPLIDRVHRHMIHVETETRSIEQRIVDWVSSNQVPSDDAASAQLQAICDGILEGRWKS